MLGSGEDPYINMIQYDMHSDEDMIHFNLSEESNTRRISDYDQNVVFRYFARYNPIGSEELHLEDLGERFGKAVYSSFDQVMDEDTEIYMLNDSTWNKAGEDPREVACEVIFSLRDEMDQVFYQSAMESVEQYAFENELRPRSEI